MRRIFTFPGVNPEPWAIGPLGYRNVSGKPRPYIGPNLKLQSYQAELKEDLIKALGPDKFRNPYGGSCSIKFLFWRRLDKWDTPTGRKSGAHAADVTNLQKGTEDALQGILITNDRNVRTVQSQVVEQSEDTNPGLIIVFDEYYTPDYWSYVSPDTLDSFNIDRNATALDLGNSYE